MRYPERDPGCSRYGADMGRWIPEAPFLGRVRARRIRLDRDGYDAGGAYWGAGRPLYYVYGAEGGERFLRAWDNASAVRKALTDNRENTK